MAIKQPGSMLEDYSDVIKQSQVHVAMAEGRVVGAIVLQRTAEGFYVDNVAVRSSSKGTGVGRQLLELAEAEARRQGYDSIYLATHELMVENRALYVRIGYVEYDHRVVNGYCLGPIAPSAWRRAPSDEFAGFVMLCSTNPAPSVDLPV